MNLINKKCKPCEGGVPPLNKQEVDIYIQSTPEWSVSEANNKISRSFSFQNFIKTMKFVNAVAEIAEKGIVLECCPISNFATGVYKDYSDHPLPKLMAAGCKVTLNSDDPPYFATTIGHEYEQAAAGFGFTPAQLLDITRNAINGAFVDAATKVDLLQKVDAYQIET